MRLSLALSSARGRREGQLDHAGGVASFMSGECAPDEGDRGNGPPGDRGVHLTELGFGDVQAAGRDRRAKLDEDRPQVNLDREVMTRPAAGHDRYRDRPGQPVAAVTVEECLQHAGIGSLVGGRREDDDVSGGDLCGQPSSPAYGTLQGAMLVSLQRMAIGFTFGAVIAIALALVAGLSRLGENAVDPLLQILRTLPLFGLIPVFIVWFGIGNCPRSS